MARRRLSFWRFVTVLVTYTALHFSAAQSQTSGGSYTIQGRATNAITGSSLAHASISLEEPQDNALIASATTDENGVFQFTYLPAGKYVLRGSHRGYLTTAYEAHESFTTALVIGNGQRCCENLLLQLIPEGVISGTVAEDTGDPVESGSVTLYHETNRTGTEAIQRVRSVTVNEGGMYEFSDLEPGNYFLSVSATPWYNSHSPLIHSISGQHDTSGESGNAALDLVYATTFYAETTDADSATPIPIKGGDHLRINFALHPVPAVHLHLHAASPLSIPAIHQQIFGTSEPVMVSSIFSSNGEIEARIPPGQYEVNSHGREGAPGKQLQLNASTDQSIDIASAAAPSLADVTGKFALSSREALPDDIFASLININGDTIGTARLNGDGTCTIRGVPPGVYRLQIEGSGKRLHVLKMAANGALVDHRQITIGSDQVTLAATLSPDHGLAISGFARKDSDAVSGAMIVLVPDDPAHNQDLFRRQQSNSDGSFTITNVEPGKYTVVAIQDGWTLDWAQPEIMRHYLQQGEPIVITTQNPQITQLKEAVPVQVK